MNSCKSLAVSGNCYSRNLLHTTQSVHRDMLPIELHISYYYVVYDFKYSCDFYLAQFSL